jgi:amino acid transporter
MPWQELLDLELPAASAFEAGLHSPLLAKTVLVAALLGLLTTWNAVFLCASRVLFSLGRARILPPAFGRIHGVFGSPSVAVVFSGLVAAVLVLMGREALLHLVNVAATCLASGFLLTSLGVIRLRKTHPDSDRPYRVPGGRITAAAGASGSLLMLLLSLYLPYRGAGGKFPIEWMVFLAWAVAGVAFWLMGASIREKMSDSERRTRILGMG